MTVVAHCIEAIFRNDKGIFLRSAFEIACKPQIRNVGNVAVCVVKRGFFPLYGVVVFRNDAVRRLNFQNEVVATGFHPQFVPFQSHNTFDQFFVTVVVVADGKFRLKLVDVVAVEHHNVATFGGGAFVYPHHRAVGKVWHHGFARNDNSVDDKYAQTHHKHKQNYHCNKYPCEDFVPFCPQSLLLLRIGRSVFRQLLYFACKIAVICIVHFALPPCEIFPPTSKQYVRILNISVCNRRRCAQFARCCNRKHALCVLLQCRQQ